MKSNYRFYNSITNFEQLAEQVMIKEQRILPIAIFFAVYRLLGYYCDQALRSISFFRKAKKVLSCGFFACPIESSQIFCWHLASELRASIKIDSTNSVKLHSNEQLYCLLKKLIQIYSDIPANKEYGLLYNFSSISNSLIEDDSDNIYMSSNPSNDSLISDLHPTYDVEFVRILNYLLEYIICILSGQNVHEFLRMDFCKRQFILTAHIALLDFTTLDEDDYLFSK